MPILPFLLTAPIKSVNIVKLVKIGSAMYIHYFSVKNNLAFDYFTLTMSTLNCKKIK